MFAAAPEDAATLNIKQTEKAGDGLVFSSLPGLISLNVQGTRLSVPQRKVIAQQAGQRLSKLKGRGMEFDEVRPYTPGDDVRHLDWRVTARTGKAHTKLFREERERPILMSVDYRASMFFASKGVFKSVQAARLAAMLAWMGNRDGDRVGGQVFTDRILHDYKPQKGRHSVLRLLNDLAELSIPPWLNQDTNSKRKGEHINEDAAFSHAYDRLVRHARPGTMIFLISDFRDWDSNTQLQVSRMGRHSDIALIFLYDPLETGLPADRRFRFTDGKQFAVIDTHSEESRQFYHDHFIQRMNAVENFARSKKIPLLKCSTTDNPFSVLMSRFSR
ncbi:MAG: DUF58 domain-containing protein [Gammaproteobacteria bacterium]|nr:DUF58 domain-containing protein [Gammaproteobacteria bacterium]